MRPFFLPLVLLILTTIVAIVDALPTPASRTQSFSVSTSRPPSSLIAAAAAPPAEPTAPAHWRHAERDDHGDREKEPKTTNKKATKTDSNGKTVIVNVTTVLVVTGNDGSHDANKVYPNDKDRANQQDVPSNTSSDNNNDSVSDPNNGDNVTEQLLQDQAALKRMITILSVVGGVGAIAVVVSVVVFTRMRSRKRKLLEGEEEALQANGSSSNNNNDTPTVDSTSMTSRSDMATLAEPTAPPLTPSPSSSAHVDHMMPTPSAPPAPAPFLATLNPSTYDRRQNVVSIGSQTAPAPSAPSAKELDAMIELPSRQPAGSSTAVAAEVGGSLRPRHNHHPSLSDTNKPCPHCEQEQQHHHRRPSTSSIEPPEVPPPAYTPSAPPIYALPPEPVVLFRRHSQG